MAFHPNGVKAGFAGRDTDYRVWRSQALLAGVSDVDQIEYRFKNGELIPVAVIELGALDNSHPSTTAPADGFWPVTEAKLAPERPQGRLLRLLADRLMVPLLQVIYYTGRLAELGLWVKRMDTDGPWQHLTLTEYRARLGRL